MNHYWLLMADYEYQAQMALENAEQARLLRGDATRPQLRRVLSTAFYALLAMWMR